MTVDAWGCGRVLLVAAVSLTVVLATRLPPDSDRPEVYDAFCRGVMAADPNEKLRWLDAAAQVDPVFAPIYKERGMAYVEKRQYDRAVQDYTRAIELRPNYAEAFIMRATAEYLMRSFDRAWLDVSMWRKLGGIVEPPFLAELRKASGRNE